MQPEKAGIELEGCGDKEDVEENEERETVIRIYSMEITLFSIKQNLRKKRI